MFSFMGIVNPESTDGCLQLVVLISYLILTNLEEFEESISFHPHAQLDELTKSDQEVLMTTLESRTDIRITHLSNDLPP